MSHGLGANFDAGGSFSTHKVGVHFDAGATLGLGVNFGVDLSVNPSEVAHTVTDFGKGALHAGGEVVSALNPCD